MHHLIVATSIFYWFEINSRMDDETRQWLIIIAACIAGSIQVYQVIIGEAGSLGIIGAVAWLVVILISSWQLRRSPN